MYLLLNSSLRSRNTFVSNEALTLSYTDFFRLVLHGVREGGGGTKRLTFNLSKLTFNLGQ